MRGSNLSLTNKALCFLLGWHRDNKWIRQRLYWSWLNTSSFVKLWTKTISQERNIKGFWKWDLNSGETKFIHQSYQYSLSLICLNVSEVNPQKYITKKHLLNEQPYKKALPKVICAQRTWNSKWHFLKMRIATHWSLPLLWN